MRVFLYGTLMDPAVARRVAGEDGFVHEILGEHRFAEAVRGDHDDVLALGQKVQRQDAFDRRPMDRLGPLPLPISHRLEAAQVGVSQAAFDALPQARLQFGMDQAFELHHGTPTLLRRPRDKVIQFDGGVDEPELSELVTQRRRHRIG